MHEARQSPRQIDTISIILASSYSWRSRDSGATCKQALYLKQPSQRLLNMAYRGHAPTSRLLHTQSLVRPAPHDADGGGQRDAFASARSNAADMSASRCGK